jgi:hypothetical protein
MPTRVQAGRQLVLRMNHRAVVAEVARLLADHETVGDVRRLIGLEVLEERQPREIDAVLDAVQDRPLRHHLRIDRLARLLLIRVVDLVRGGAEEPRDARARREHVGRDLRAFHAIEDQQGVAALRRECPHDRGDFLVGRNFVVDYEDIVRVLCPVLLEERVKVLAHFTPAYVSLSRALASSMLRGGGVGLMPHRRAMLLPM